MKSGRYCVSGAGAKISVEKNETSLLEREQSCARQTGCGGQGCQGDGGVGAVPSSVCGNVRMRVKKQAAVTRARPGSEVWETSGRPIRGGRPLSCIEGAKQQEKFRICRGQQVTINLMYLTIICDNLCIFIMEDMQ